MYINRKNKDFLKKWKSGKGRKPLIIRGARQTGKSWLVSEFGKSDYGHLVVLNFEGEPSLKALFEKEDVFEIVRELEVIKDTPIIPGKTLVFLDEIQECPPAIIKLRYFYEEMSEQHIIAAGSLLEFVLENEQISFPVGRVEFNYLFPLTFEEFLKGLQKGRLLDTIKNASVESGIPQLVHNELNKILTSYFLIGGMPEAAASFIEDRQYRQTERIKESIIETYRDDFKKYSKRVNVDNVDFIFTESPKWIGRGVNLSKMGAGDIRSRDAGVALNLLQRAMILHRANRIRSVCFPLLPYKKARPKLVFLDIGLAQYMNGISKEILQSKSFHDIYKGGLVDQFVGQEFLAVFGERKRYELFYWHREERGASAEIDYLLPFENHLLPVEVKSGKGTTLYSMNQFMLKYKTPFAIRIYDGSLRLEKLETSVVSYRLLSVPLYMIGELPRLIEGVLNDRALN